MKQIYFLFFVPIEDETSVIQMKMTAVNRNLMLKVQRKILFFIYMQGTVSMNSFQEVQLEGNVQKNDKQLGSFAYIYMLVHQSTLDNQYLA